MHSRAPSRGAGERVARSVVELRRALGDHPAVGDIRGRGLFWGVELVRDRDSRQPFDPDVQKLIEQQNPGLTFDWETIVNTPMPPPDMTEYWRERRRQEKAAKQERRAAEAAEVAEPEEQATEAAETSAEPDEPDSALASEGTAESEPAGPPTGIDASAEPGAESADAGAAACAGRGGGARAFHRAAPRRLRDAR